MEEKWVVAAKKADFYGIGRHFGIDPVIARIMRNRGLTELSQMELYLHGTKEDLHDPHLLKDVDLAASIILKKAKEKKKIRIIGDYDIDGIQATYILVCGLRRIGAAVDTVIPDRIRDGYGLNEHLVTRAHADGVDTIITCDNGISALEQINLAKSLGMTVVVTDHHEVPFEETAQGRRELSSEADAVINPKQEGCSYPFSKLCGAAVAWKFVQVLYEHAQIPVEEADIFLENAGFATIGDVMDLEGENRILVKLSLQMLRNTKNIGMRALILQNGLKPEELKCYHVGFKIGPCLNASGRLETARLSLRLLLCQNPEEAAVLAHEIVELNESRKLLTADAVNLARKQVEEQNYAQDQVLVLFLPDCHESIAGIVAGRIREAYYRPTLIITRGEEGAKGSGRSIEGYSMYEELCKCRELFTKFGGHPMAAGFSLEEHNIDALRIALNRNAALTEAELTPKVIIDVPMPLDYITEELVEQLELLEPFGKGNEKPVFADRNLVIESFQFMGKSGRAMRMRLRSAGGRSMEAIFFGDSDDLHDALERKYGRQAAEDTMQGRCIHNVSLHVLYYPEIDHYYAQPRLQIRVLGFRA